MNPKTVMNSKTAMNSKTTAPAAPWLILGAGSLGRLLACRLAGHVELALLARQANREPLLLTDPEGAQSAQRIARLRIAQAPPTPALVHVTTKSHAVESALEELAVRVAPATPLVLWQNGYQVQPSVTRGWPGPVLCATTSEGAYTDGEDGVVHAGQGYTFIGHLDGVHGALATHVASVLDRPGWPAKRVTTFTAACGTSWPSMPRSILWCRFIAFATARYVTPFIGHASRRSSLRSRPSWPLSGSSRRPSAGRRMSGG